MKHAVVTFFYSNGTVASSIEVKSPTVEKLKHYVDEHKRHIEFNTGEDVIVRPYHIKDITETYQVPVKHMAQGYIEVEALDKVDLLEKLVDDDFVSDLAMPKTSSPLKETLEIDFESLGIKRNKKIEIYVLSITTVATDVFNIETEIYVKYSFKEAFDLLKDIIEKARLDIQLEEGQDYVNYYVEDIGSFVAQIESKVVE